MRLAVSRAPDTAHVVSLLEHRVHGNRGALVFLVAQFLSLRWALGDAPRSRPLGVAALAILAVATAPLALPAGIAASCAVLVAVAVADAVGAAGRAPSWSR